MVIHRYQASYFQKLILLFQDLCRREEYRGQRRVRCDPGNHRRQRDPGGHCGRPADPGGGPGAPSVHGALRPPGGAYGLRFQPVYDRILLIFGVNDPKTFQEQILVVDDLMAAVGRDGFRQPAGGNHSGLFTQLFGKAVDHAVQHGGAA